MVLKSVINPSVTTV